jgi:hypothetical protein
MSQSWKDRARDVILAVMRGALADGVDRAEMLCRVDESYPFGPRKNYPYQAWLEVRRALLFESVPDGTPVPSHKRKPSEAKLMRLAGERDMFEGDNANTR